MKKLNVLNLGKSLNRAEMKVIKGGKLPGGGGGIGSAICYDSVRYVAKIPAEMNTYVL